MYLGKIVIGKNSSVGLKAHVAAGSTLPEDTLIGASSSSYEMDNESNEDRRDTRAVKPHPLTRIFVILPIQVVVLFISSLPWMLGLFGIVSTQPTQSTDSVRMVITWWASAHRISFHYLAQILHVAVQPFFWFACVFVLKRLVDHFCGKVQPKPAYERTQKDLLRTHIMTALVPHGGLKSLTKLFGSHYEFTSMAVRAMGGKVGKRVYWPGTGPTITDFDLIEIGDDVVFGSRSHIISSDTIGTAAIKVGSGAMIADRVVLSPGATVGPGTILGSGAFINRGQSCAPSTVWVGNRKGGAVCLSATSSKSPTLLGTPGNGGSEKSSLRKVKFQPENTSQRTSICDTPIRTSGDVEKMEPMSVDKEFEKSEVSRMYHRILCSYILNIGLGIDRIFGQVMLLLQITNN